MAGVNKVILVGNLGKDPELTYTPSGTAIAKFSLATAEKRKNAEGEWADHTEWHNIVVFGRTAENASQYLSKGRQVYVEGRISTRRYEREGTQQYYTEIVCNTLQYLGKRDDYDSPRPSGDSSGGRQAGPQKPPAPPMNQGDNSDYEEDLPF